MKKSVKEKVLRRFEAGEEPVQIVAKFSSEVSQATVYRWISEFENKNKALSGVENDEPDVEGEDDFDTFRDSIEVDYEDDETARTGYDETDQDVSEEINPVDLLGLKRKIIKRFRKYLNEILTYSSGYEWKSKHLRRMQNKLDEIQDEIEEILQFDSNAFQKNAFWVILDSFIERFQGYSSAGGDVELDLIEDDQDLIREALKLNEFEQEFNWEADFKNRYNRFADLIDYYDGEKLNDEVIQDLRFDVDRIREVMKDYDLEETFSDARDSLRDVDRDLKKVEIKASESIWETALFELDEDFFTFED